MVSRHFYSENEKVILTSLCYNFGAFFPVYFPENTLKQKIYELAFHIPCFVDQHGIVRLLSEEEGESSYHLINLEAAQLAYVRNDPETLQLIGE